MSASHHRRECRPGAPGIVVGLRAEARIAHGLGWRVLAGGGSVFGAGAAASRLVAEGVSALVSFGLAGGLEPSLRPGTVIVPRCVHVDGRDLETDPALCSHLGGATRHRLLGADMIARTRLDKAHLRQGSGADAIDLESGPVAKVARQAGLPFAVLRAICDPAERDLPQAALAALDHHGVIGLGRVAASLLRNPAQVAALIVLARDASAARSALIRRIRIIREGSLLTADASSNR